MKSSTLKLSVLAAFALAGGVVTTLQAKTSNGEVYDVNFSLYNNNVICEVYGLPTVDISDGSVDVLDSSVTVDGAGKITGFAYLQLSTTDGTSTVMATVTGKMGMKGTSPVANMTIKGPGYSTSGGTDGKASLSMKFSGTGVYASGSSSAVYTGYEMDGKVNGSFKPGIKGANKIKVKNAAGTISSGDVSARTQLDTCSLTLVAVNKNLTLGGCLINGNGDYYHNEFNGKGKANLKNGQFNFTLTGTGEATSSKIKVKGNSTSVNPSLDSASDVNLTSITASGKVMGQKVDATGDGYLTLESPTN